MSAADTHRPPGLGTQCQHASEGEIAQSVRATWRVTVEEISDPDSVEERWRALEPHAMCSFFQSWGWVGTWLKTFPTRNRPILLQATRNGEVVGLSVLGRNALSRMKLLSSRALLVSETGIPADDALTVEHSGLLMYRGLEADIIEQCLQALGEVSIEWDELYISGVERGHVDAYLQAAELANLRPVVRADHPYFFVDLSSLAAQGTRYLGSLSSNSRYQVRRAFRAYEKRGPVSFRIAEDVHQAYEYFASLRQLHQSYWNARNFPGAFATDSSNEFHERLIASRFEHGEIQLAELRAGDYVFGYLYSFVFNGVVSNYQSGFRYETDGKIKPGFVGHTLAVEHNLALGHRVYDFLVGDQRFKRSLATDEERMIWLVLQRDRLKFRVEDKLRALRDRWFS